jgi:hypothetical protein
MTGVAHAAHSAPSNNAPDRSQRLQATLRMFLTPRVIPDDPTKNELASQNARNVPARKPKKSRRDGAKESIP